MGGLGSSVARLSAWKIWYDSFYCKGGAAALLLTSIYLVMYSTVLQGSPLNGILT